jgi:hypothetical protein
MLVSVGAAIWALYIRDFGGFPNLDGWDGGTHVLIKDQFATAIPAPYNGQITYHALAWWFEQILGLDSLQSFSAAFYIGVAGAVAFPVTILVSLLKEEMCTPRLSIIVGYVVSLLATLAIFWWVWLPLLHYNQAAGYYAHLFGLWPLGMLWAADAVVRSPLWRVTGLLLGLVLLRFTYALNLADAFVAVAFVLLLQGAPGRWRIIVSALAIGLGVAAWLVLSQLRPVFRIWGGIQRFTVDEILRADLFLAGGGIVYAVLGSLTRRPREWANSQLVRALRFPILFALAGSSFLPLLRTGPGVKQYYVTKYLVWSCMLLAFALVFMLAHLSMALLRKSAFRSITVWLRVALLASLCAIVPGVWQKTFAGYRETFQERLLAKGPPYRFLRPLGDAPTISRIKKTLSAEHKAFGGYLTAFFPTFSFMNATMGYHTGVQDFFPPLTTPGHCVFWVTKERDTYRLGPAQKLDAIRDRVASAGATCTEYSVPWKSTPQSLCYHCY